MVQAKTARKPARRTRKKKVDPKAVYLELLTEKRQEILDLYEHDLRVGQAASDEGAEDLVDRANSAYNKEFMFSLSSGEREVLFEIEEALNRIEGKRFGVCEACGEEVPSARLKAVPWARYCIDCQEKVEQGMTLDTD